jgi:hypothetical protein
MAQRATATVLQIETEVEIEIGEKKREGDKSQEEEGMYSQHTSWQDSNNRKCAYFSPR